MKRNLNELIKHLYEKSGLSYVKLAEGCKGVSSQTLFNWSTGKCCKIVDVHMLTMLFNTFKEEEVINAIKQSAKDLSNKDA